MAKNPEDFAPRQQAIKAEALTPATWKHNPADPVVVVSTMQFGFSIPLWDESGRIPATAKDGGLVQPTFEVRTEIGLTVLSSMVSIFDLFEIDLGAYAPPPKDETKRWARIFVSKPERLAMPPFVDEAAGLPKVGEIEGMLLRAFEHIGMGCGMAYNPMHPDRSRFVTAPGRTHPEVMVMRASSIWADGKEGNDARSILLASTRYAKSEAHVGALHDMAVLAGSQGYMIAEACRKRAAHAGWRK